MSRRIIQMNVIPGEPLDGSGRVCIHLFIPDKNGTFTEPSVLHPRIEDGNRVGNELVIKPTKGMLACDPKRNAATVIIKGVTVVTPRTDDPRAVTCPKCIASPRYKLIMDTLDRLMKETASGVQNSDNKLEG